LEMPSNEKVCARCGVFGPHNKDASHRSGLQRMCRECTARNNSKHQSRYAAEKLAWIATHPDTLVCGEWNCYEPAAEAFALNGHPRCRRHGEPYMKQDLATFPPVARGTTPTGRRWFKVTLPVPSWSKHNRVAVNPKGGGRFLRQDAKEYQQWLCMLRVVAELEEGWIRGEYILSVTTYHPRLDDDQHAGGLKDGFVTSGFTVDDKLCYRTITTRIRVPKAEQRLVIFCKEKAGTP
jgi:hypothetical protein